MRASEIIERTEKGVKESNKILIQELIQDLEEKGIKPVVAIDGEVKSLKLIDESELKDFNKEIEINHLNKIDFCVLEADETKNCDNFYVPCGKVVVVYKKLGRIKKYRVGNGANWVADFAQDLQNKFFTN